MRLLEQKACGAQGKPQRQARRMVGMLRDTSGSFALTFALISLPLMIAIGCSLDYVRAVNMQRKMQVDLDAALLAAVQKVTTSDEAALTTEIAQWLEAQAESQHDYALDASGIRIDTTNATITASANATVATTFLNIIGIEAVPVSITSAVMGGTTSTATQNPFSMYLVLDQSGSMAEETNTTYTTTCYRNTRKKTGAYSCTQTYTKIEALKLAVNDLIDKLATLDPEDKYIRTAAVSYNEEEQAPTALAWSKTAVVTYVDALSADGSTNSSGAIATAYAALVDASDKAAHKSKNGSESPQKNIVLMTDGANTKTSYDTRTKATCDLARANKVTVYAIAFMAPAQGKALLEYCATTSSDYFEAENTAQLVDAFEVIGETSSKSVIRLTQ